MSTRPFAKIAPCKSVPFKIFLPTFMDEFKSLEVAFPWFDFPDDVFISSHRFFLQKPDDIGTIAHQSNSTKNKITSRDIPALQAKASNVSGSVISMVKADAPKKPSASSHTNSFTHSLTPSHKLCSRVFIEFWLKFGFKKSLSHFFAARLSTQLDRRNNFRIRDSFWFC